MGSAHTARAAIVGEGAAKLIVTAATKHLGVGVSGTINSTKTNFTSSTTTLHPTLLDFLELPSLPPFPWDQSISIYILSYMCFILSQIRRLAKDGGRCRYTLLRRFWIYFKFKIFSLAIEPGSLSICHNSLNDFITNTLPRQLRPPLS